jgi:hypothetical protein
MLPMAPEQSRSLHVPDWIVDWDIPMRNVVFSEEILQKVEKVYETGLLEHCHGVQHCVEFITQVMLNCSASTMHNIVIAYVE